MDINFKLETNRKIRKYEGTNSLLLSLQRQLKSSKYLQKIEVGGKTFKILSDNQYNAASGILDSNL